MGVKGRDGREIGNGSEGNEREIGNGSERNEWEGK